MRELEILANVMNALGFLLLMPNPYRDLFAYWRKEVDEMGGKPFYPKDIRSWGRRRLYGQAGGLALLLTGNVLLLILAIIK